MFLPQTIIKDVFLKVWYLLLWFINYMGHDKVAFGELS